MIGLPAKLAATLAQIEADFDVACWWTMQRTDVRVRVALHGYLPEIGERMKRERMETMQ